MAGSKIMKRGRGRPSRIGEVKKKIDSFLDVEDERIYSKRELARRITEHPSAVYRALQRCIEGDDLDPPTVVLIRGMGYCHKRHEASLRKKKEQLSTFRQIIQEEGATTQTEDEVALMVKKHAEKATANVRFFTRNRFFRWLARRTPESESFLRKLDEDPEKTAFRPFTVLVGIQKGKDVNRTWEIYDRWRRKPKG